MSDKIIEQIYQRLRRVGAAIDRVEGNNTHSGNLSMRHPQDRDLFFITSTGAQCGCLIPQDIVPLKFSDISWGDARGSTESTIHRKVLSLPEVNSVVHAHYLYTTFISFDTREKQLFLQFVGTDNKGREEFIFHPVDLYGHFALGSVRVGSYLQPVGSAEMEERIPKYLTKDKVTIVRGHGSFACGKSPEEALYLMSLLENSAKLSITLRRRGVDTAKLQKSIMTSNKNAPYSFRPHLFDDINFSICEVKDETIIDDFSQRLNYNYNHQLGTFGTGSMSQKVSSDEMIYCPTSAVPEDFKFPLIRSKITFQKNDSLDIRIHKLIYQHTHLNTCMITTSPLATAEGMAVMAEKYGVDSLLGEKHSIPYKPDNHPVIIPIDAEAKYLNPRVGLVDIYHITNMSDDNPILNMLRWHKGCCIVSGYGVISAGSTTLEQAAHNASSVERIARFRIEAFINEKISDGTPLKFFEQEQKNDF